MIWTSFLVEMGIYLKYQVLKLFVKQALQPITLFAMPKHEYIQMYLFLLKGLGN